MVPSCLSPGLPVPMKGRIGDCSGNEDRRDNQSLWV